MLKDTLLIPSQDVAMTNQNFAVSSEDQDRPFDMIPIDTVFHLKMENVLHCTFEHWLPLTSRYQLEANPTSGTLRAEQESIRKIASVVQLYVQTTARGRETSSVRTSLMFLSANSSGLFKVAVTKSKSTAISPRDVKSGICLGELDGARPTCQHFTSFGEPPSSHSYKLRQS